MSGLLGKAEEKLGGQLQEKAQPGDGVERSADSGANNKINEIANDVGVPQGDDNVIDEAADAKINSDIPLGNN